jgi:hypothetical protein
VGPVRKYSLPAVGVISMEVKSLSGNAIYVSVTCNVFIAGYSGRSHLY